jgi:hypothetical protein
MYSSLASGEKMTERISGVLAPVVTEESRSKKEELRRGSDKKVEGRIKGRGRGHCLMFEV